jgi:hypothetical protein
MMTMKMINFALAILSVTCAVTNASISEQQLSSVSIPATSRIGNRLMSKARRLEQNGDDAYTFSWVKDYSIKFNSCHTTFEFRADASGSNDEEDSAPVESMRLVSFKLCPTNADETLGQYDYMSSCGNCRNGAEYLVEMREFLEAYLEFHMTQKEYNCEMVKENCGCEDDDQYDDDQTCYDTCYAAAGLDYCDEFASNDGDDNNDYEFDLYENLECENVMDNDDDSNTARLYVGAYCSNNGKNIYLGEFTDRQCTQKAEAGSYYGLFGQELPYQDTSIVDSDKCLSCLEPVEYDDDANNDNADGDQVREICEELYDRSAKCEQNLADGVTYSKSNGACDYMHNILPRAERVVTGKTGLTASTFFAGLFFVSTVAVAAWAVTLYRKLEGSTGAVGLSSHDGEVA